MERKRSKIQNKEDGLNLIVPLAIIVTIIIVGLLFCYFNKKNEMHSYFARFKTLVNNIENCVEEKNYPELPQFEKTKKGIDDEKPKVTKGVFSKILWDVSEYEALEGRYNVAHSKLSDQENTAKVCISNFETLVKNLEADVDNKNDFSSEERENKLSSYEAQKEEIKKNVNDLKIAVHYKKKYDELNNRYATAYKKFSKGKNIYNGKEKDNELVEQGKEKIEENAKQSAVGAGHWIKEKAGNALNWIKNLFKRNKDK